MFLTITLLSNSEPLLGHRKRLKKLAILRTRLEITTQKGAVYSVLHTLDTNLNPPYVRIVWVAVLSIYSKHFRGSLEAFATFNYDYRLPTTIHRH